MTKLRFSSIFLALFLCSCGHNLLTNYEVKGLDVSVPLFGYPVGIRAGIVKMNTNAVRGNSSYNMQEDASTTAGNTQTVKTIQFAANTQLNERNVTNILTDEDVDDTTKNLLVEEYIANSDAPALPPTSIKTPTTVSASGTDYRIHRSEDFKDVKPSSSFSLAGKSVWKSIFSAIVIKNVYEAFITFFLASPVGKAIVIILKAIVIILSSLLLLKMIRLLYRLIKKFICH